MRHRDGDKGAEVGTYKEAQRWESNPPACAARPSSPRSAAASSTAASKSRFMHMFSGCANSSTSLLLLLLLLPLPGREGHCAARWRRMAARSPLIARTTASKSAYMRWGRDKWWYKGGQVL